jgi:hypothetical protein
VIGVAGIGWIDERCYGSLRSDVVGYADRVPLARLGKTDGLLAYTAKNFGRFEPLTQRVCYAAALALKDAGIEYGESLRLNIGVLGVHPRGAVKSNASYFKDYIDSGRTLSRANLFIYTLPSSPYAEVSVHFGLQGPLLYGAHLGPLVELAQGLVKRQEADQVLVICADEQRAVCAVVGVVEHAVCEWAWLADGQGNAGVMIEKILDVGKEDIA